MADAVSKAANGLKQHIGNGAQKIPSARKRNARRKFSVSLSEQSAQVLEELREFTDADTDSEVFRNALRLHLMLVRAHRDNRKILIRDEGSDTLVAIDLFVRDADQQDSNA